MKQEPEQDLFQHHSLPEMREIGSRIRNPDDEIEFGKDGQTFPRRISFPVWPIGIVGVEEGDAAIDRVVGEGDRSCRTQTGVIYTIVFLTP